MSNVIEVLLGNDLLVWLQEVADDLDEILSSIVYDDKAEDPNYIRAMQAYVERKYGKRMKQFKSAGLSGFGLDNVIEEILCAYDELMYLGVGYSFEEPKSIREAAENGLGEHLIWADPADLS